MSDIGFGVEPQVRGKREAAEWNPSVPQVADALYAQAVRWTVEDMRSEEHVFFSLQVFFFFFFFFFNILYIYTHIYINVSSKVSFDFVAYML